ncbi:matrixin family metalloprotease [Pseudoalteromonas sp. MMG024]|uniref:matrixin family metalloprotease n=1 Tax=Pseudoalteromonas sp. MMG024 TaxID=2909980 RepID=UPI001F013F2C|nr:matrixin family metalloprotease [Pseudoalteromonas sp. MMG024]MCF6455721.1 matrixin family metalloprotease [Pseudoalteromonas sp. MMG024]
MKTFNWICQLFMLATFPVLAGSVNWTIDDSNNVSPVKWHDANLPYKWHLNDAGYNQLELTALEQQLKNAFAAWQNLPDSHLSFQYQGLSTESGSGDGSQLGAKIDGYNLVSFINRGITFTDDVLAVCAYSVFNSAIEITADNADLNGDGEADIPLGVYPAGSIFDADIFFDGSKTFSEQHIHNIALHEIGHCIGLAHSSIERTTMYPVLDTDLIRGAQIKPDDIATLASYMGKNDAQQRYGRIEGAVINGVSGETIRGAHIIAIDSETREKVVGTYSLTGGSYSLHVPVGKYLLQIEPLDATHPGLEAARMNALVRLPDAVFFEREFYDLNESSYEEGSEEPKLFDVTAGSQTSGIDFYINQKIESEFTFSLKRGLNYFSYPQHIPFGLNSHDLLQQVGQFIGVNRIEKFNKRTGGFEFAFMLNGEPQGVSFDIEPGEGYLITSETDGEMVFPGVTSCHEFELKKGLNLVAISCPPANFDSYQFISALGDSKLVESIRYYDAQTKQYFETQYQGSEVVGDRFTLTHGVAVEVRMLADAGKFALSKESITAPVINHISPGSVIKGEHVLITGQGFVTNINDNIVLLNGQRLQVKSASHNSLFVHVPETIAAGDYSLSVTVNDLTSNSAPISVISNRITEADLDSTQLLSGMIVEAAIETLGEQDIYTFVALAGSKINVMVNPINSAPMLTLQMLSPKGGLLLHESVEVASNYISVNGFEVKETGIYTLVVGAQMVGAYELSLNIEAPVGPSKISTLMGDFQTAVRGTELKEPVLLLLTDKRGQPISNADVVITQRTTSVSPQTKAKSIQQKKLGSSSTANETVDTYLDTQKSNSYGMVAVKLTGPNLISDFELEITTPGIPENDPIKLNVKVIDTPVARVEIAKTEQNCGSACTVGTELPEPWTATFLNAEGQGIEGLFVDWVVVSGDGKLGDKSGATTEQKLRLTTDATGTVKAFHKLGEQLYINNDNNITKPLITLPQVVMMTVPGQSAPVVFSAESKAGEVSKVTANRMTDLQLTMLTKSYNSIGLIAKDGYGNPVANADVKLISPGADSGISIEPSNSPSVPITGFKTNDYGIWIGSISVGNVLPTFDEFGRSDTEGLAQPYTINIQLDNHSVVYTLAVDMGPRLVHEHGTNNLSAIVGQPLDEVIEFVPHGFERSYHYANSGNRQNVWSDVRELHVNYDPINEHAQPKYALGDKTNILIDAYEIDNDTNFLNHYNITSKAEPIEFSVINSNNEQTEIKAIDTKLVCLPKEDGDCDGYRSIFSVRKGRVQVTNIGDFYANKPVLVKAVIPSYTHNVFVGNNSDKSKIFYGYKRYHTSYFYFEKLYENLSATIPIYPTPIYISFTIDDVFKNGDNDTSIYPGIKSVSGVDLNKLKITMPNGSVIDATNLKQSLHLNTAPNFAQIWLDYHQITELTDDLMEQTPAHFQLVYRPKASELNEGENSFKLIVSDSAGNEASEAICTFTYPTSIQCQQ